MKKQKLMLATFAFASGASFVHADELLPRIGSWHEAIIDNDVGVIGCKNPSFVLRAKKIAAHLLPDANDQFKQNGCTYAYWANSSAQGKPDLRTWKVEQVVDVDSRKLAYVSQPQYATDDGVKKYVGSLQIWVDPSDLEPAEVAPLPN